MHLQRTLAAPVSFSGVGIHTGTPSRVTVKPAPENSGRVFITPSGTEIPARVDFVHSCQRSVILGRDSERVHTPEHLLSALVASGIDNARIEIEGVEVPILDGSASEFFAAFQAAGVTVQSLPARMLVPTKPYSAGSPEGGLVLLTPWPEPRYEYVLHYDHPMLGCQTVGFDLGSDDYGRQIAPARTFALWEEVQPLWERGLAKGGDIDNALVVFQDRFSSPLKVEEEPARHKCLDLIGDFGLLDARLQGRVLAVKAGHRLHVDCALKLWEEMLVHERA